MTKDQCEELFYAAYRLTQAEFGRMNNVNPANSPILTMTEIEAEDEFDRAVLEI